jgi:hypothetical protein
MREQPPKGDGERWEALAFHIYSELAQVGSKARELSDELDALLTPSPERSTE